MKSCAHKRNKGLGLAILVIAILGTSFIIINSNNDISAVEGGASSPSISSGTGSNPYYSATNVSNRTGSTADGAESLYETSKASNSGNKAETGTIELCPGQSTAVTFSHNIYSHSTANNVDWTVTRTGFDTPGMNVTMDKDLNGNEVSSQNSAQSVDGVATGSVNIGTEFNNNVVEFNGYTANASDGSRQYSDLADPTSAGPNEGYVHRDYYNISFDQSAVGSTVNLCESMSVGGNAASSQGCTSIYVKNCGGTPTIPPDYPYYPPVPVIPPDPNVTTVKSQVRNVTKNGAFGVEIYAEPGDEVEWRHEYYSGVQNVADEIVSSNEHIEHDSGLSEGDYPQVNMPISQFGVWQNQFTVSASGFEREPVTKTFPIGQVSTEVYTDTYVIEEGASGTLVEKIKSGSPSRVVIKEAENTKWNCDCHDGDCKKCSHGSGAWIESERIGAVEESARVKIPFSFALRNDVKIPDTVFAGEKTTISGFNVGIESRENGLVGASYATGVQNVKMKVFGLVSTDDLSGKGGREAGDEDQCASYQWRDVYGIYDGKCAELVSMTDDYLDVDEEAGFSNRIVDVFDVPAGYYFCVAGAVYPAGSGSNLNNYDPEGNHKWKVSNFDCALIGKKPSIQVWGAGLYTANKIALPLAEKRIVNGVLNDLGLETEFRGTATANVAFGSWVEQNIVANGLVAHLASGAADGLAGSMVSRTKDGLDGSYSSSALGSDVDCVLSPLTMPNDKCSVVSSPGGTAGSMNKPTDKSAITARFVEGNNADFMVHNECSISGTPSFAEKKTHVYKCDNKFTISGDVAYFDNTYTSLIDVPKIIIHAKNIEIGCGVSQVDAVLIADDTVNTCNNDDVNSIERANQLVINGSVIANKMVANRTYGGARGANSGVPAEIVNYDTSLYLWGSPRADVSGSGKLETVYQTELSPRF